MQTFMATQAQSTRVKRNQRNMMIVIGVILAVISGLFLAMRHIAKQHAAAHTHTFYQYVVTHHLGSLQEIDDGTGLDPNSYVLTLAKPISDDQVKALATSLMYLYVEYDHGYTLTIFNPHTGANKSDTEIAESHYDDDRGILTLTLFPESSQPMLIHQKVDW